MGQHQLDRLTEKDRRDARQTKDELLLGILLDFFPKDHPLEQTLDYLERTP